jgi:hypothetical protein
MTTEWTWEKILEHLKYEESVCLKIYNKKKNSGPQAKTLDSEDIHEIKKLDRDARKFIYRHLVEKKEILSNALAQIELADYYLRENNRYSNGSLSVLLYQIQKAIKLVNKQQTNQSIYRIYSASIAKDYVMYGEPGFSTTTHSPENLFTSRVSAFAEIKHQLHSMNFLSGSGIPRYINIMCVSNDHDSTWFTKLLISCDIRNTFLQVYRGQYFDSSMNEGFNTLLAQLKKHVKNDKKHIIKVKPLNKRFIFIERNHKK